MAAASIIVDMHEGTSRDARERKRILLLAESPYMGGITSHILSIVRAFGDSDRFEFVVATLEGRRGDRTLIEVADKSGIAVHVMPMSWAFDFGVMGRFRKFLAEREIDLVHTHNYRSTLVCALAGGPVPVVNTSHGMKVESSLRMRFWQWADLRAMRRHGMTVACSDFVRDWLVRQGLDEKKVCTVYNCYAPPDNAGPAPSRESLGFGEDSLVVAYIGRLVEGKGLEHLVEALKDVPGSAGLFVGDGPLRAALESKAKEHGINAQFTGAVAEPSPFYQLADLVVLPSKMEALPITLIEAAAHGKPCIASKSGGIPEVVADGENGILFDYADVDALRIVLMQLYESPLREKMGNRASEIWRDKFSPDRMANELAEVYDQALGG